MTVIDRQQSVPRQVYDLLRDKIQTTELKPGQSINERRLAEWLQVSRTPIREAIRRLAGEGLITIVAHVGTSVTPVDPARVKECCVIRLSLECAAVEAAAVNFTAAADKRLERLIARQDETIDTGDFVANVEADTEFHRTIQALSGYPTIGEILHRVMGEITRARHLSIKLPGRLREPVDEHRAILNALRTGDPERAAAAMRSHLELSIASILRALETSAGPTPVAPRPMPGASHRDAANPGGRS